jgi:hypothetical protein
VGVAWDHANRRVARRFGHWPSRPRGAVGGRLRLQLRATAAVASPTLGPSGRCGARCWMGCALAAPSSWPAPRQTYRSGTGQFGPPPPQSHRASWLGAWRRSGYGEPRPGSGLPASKQSCPNPSESPPAPAATLGSLGQPCDGQGPPSCQACSLAARGCSLRRSLAVERRPPSSYKRSDQRAPSCSGKTVASGTPA